MPFRNSSMVDGRSTIVKKPGFSLVEILISLVLIMAIVLVLFSASGALTATRGTNLQDIASKIANRQMETLRKTAYASLPACSSPCALSDTDLSKLPSGTATQTISSYQSSADIKQATIQVSWNQNGAAKQVKIETLIYKNGI